MVGRLCCRLHTLYTANLLNLGIYPLEDHKTSHPNVEGIRAIIIPPNGSSGLPCGDALTRSRTYVVSYPGRLALQAHK